MAFSDDFYESLSWFTAYLLKMVIQAVLVPDVRPFTSWGHIPRVLVHIPITGNTTGQSSQVPRL